MSSVQPRRVKIKLIIAYDGAGFAGWQVQVTGIGVQQRIEEAISKIIPGLHRLHSSSRTDAGVHALGMVAHVELPARQFRMTPSKLALALNAVLPPEIRILRASRCAADFHARFDAIGKQYRYFVWNQPAMNPLLRHQAWHVPQRLDYDAMRSAAGALVGKHDFKSFAATRHYEMESTVRTLTRFEIKRAGPLLTFIIEGDGFLYKMCRGIVGTLVQLGRHKYTRADLKVMLAARDRQQAGMTAPAQGLVLWKVIYPKRSSARLRKPDHEHRVGRT